MDSISNFASIFIIFCTNTINIAIYFTFLLS
nr:MAG TPA: hypothetical protein [Caudoviricetes sp.]